MTKKALIDQLAATLDLTKIEATQTLNQVFKIMTDLLTEEKEIRLPEFGKFTSVHKAARAGRHPATGKILQMPAKVVPVFKPSSLLKELIAQKVKAKPIKKKKKII